MKEYGGLDKITLDFVQERDTSAPISNESVNEMKLETVNNGIGNYFVISTERWAFDDLEDFVRYIKQIIELEKLTFTAMEEKANESNI